MSITCAGCTQRERIIGELEDENRRLGEKIVVLKDELRVIRVSHSIVNEAINDGY